MSAGDARRLTEAALGLATTGVRRFSTGLHHYVYEVTLADGRRVVMRMTRLRERQTMRDAVDLSRRLRPLGVPLPDLLDADLDGVLPWMLLERLDGVDLGDVVGQLPPASLRMVAERVASAQHIVATLPAEGRYGYAARASEAPFERWSAVVDAHLARSRQRMAAAGLFDLGLVDRVEALARALRADLDKVACTPFLHDTTTKNVIVTRQGTFSGIVDVDDLCFGDPRYVAALTLVALRAHGKSDDYAQGLLQAAGWHDDECFRLYVAAFVLDFMSEHGQRFNANERVSSAEDRQRLMELYQGAVADLQGP